MKVNEWINQKFRKSIIRLTQSIEHGRQNCGKALHFSYVCIYYDIDIAIAYGGRIRHRTKTSLEA